MSIIYSLQVGNSCLAQGHSTGNQKLLIQRLGEVRYIEIILSDDEEKFVRSNPGNQPVLAGVKKYFEEQGYAVGLSSAFEKQGNDCTRLKVRVSYAVIYTTIRDFTLELYDCQNTYWSFTYNKDLPNNALVNVSAKVSKASNKLLEDFMVQSKGENPLHNQPSDRTSMPIYGW